MGQDIKQKEVVLQGSEQQTTLPEDAVIQEVYKNSSKTGEVREREVRRDTKQTTTGAESSLS